MSGNSCRSAVRSSTFAARYVDSGLGSPSPGIDGRARVTAASDIIRAEAAIATYIEDIRIFIFSGLESARHYQERSNQNLPE